MLYIRSFDIIRSFDFLKIKCIVLRIFMFQNSFLLEFLIPVLT